MRDSRIWRFTVVPGLLWLVACGGAPGPAARDEVAPTPRRMVVWLEDGGLDAATAVRLAEVGVDELVVRRGSILLSAGAPVVRLSASPSVQGALPLAVALEVNGLDDDRRDADADAVWAALAADFGDRLPAELILDLPELRAGAPAFISRLIRTSGLGVVPVLSIAQLETEIGRQAARAANRCIVPVFGFQRADLRGLTDAATRPLDVRLAPIRDLGVKVRLAAALRPVTDPEAAGWAADVDPLTGEVDVEISRTSTLDRSFLARRAVEWAGLSLAPGQTVATAWVDTPRLNAFFTDSHRMILPEVAGWDLVSLPPAGNNLGLDREELIRYLAGEGPAPIVEVRLDRRGRTATVTMANAGVFRSTITGVGTWVQLELASGALVAESRGDFDRIVLGRVVGGDWRPKPSGPPDAVRFYENYLAPGETMTSGTVRLPSSRSRVGVRWQVQLSDGSVVTGVVR